MLYPAFGEKLVKAVKDGLVPEERIDDAALQVSVRAAFAEVTIRNTANRLSAATNTCFSS